MKINTFENLLELLSTIRSHVDSTSEHVHACHNYFADYLCWKNESKTQEWKIEMRWYSVPELEAKRDKLSQLIYSSMFPPDILDKYLNYGDRVLDLLPFT